MPSLSAATDTGSGWPVTVPPCLADYDAVLTEAGDYTAKYTKLRELFGSISGTCRTTGSTPA